MQHTTSRPARLLAGVSRALLLLVLVAGLTACDDEGPTGPIGDITGSYQLGGLVDGANTFAVDGSLQLSNQTETSVAAQVVFQMVSSTGATVTVTTSAPVPAVLDGNRIVIEVQQSTSGGGTLRLVLDGRIRGGVIEGDWTLSDASTTVGGTFAAER